MIEEFHDVPAGKVAAVVTHLAMERPASLPQAPELPLRHVPSPEVQWYRDLFTRVGAIDWMWFSRLNMSSDELEQILSDGDVEVHALEQNGRAEGLLELDFRAGHSCELAFLGLTSAAQGQGFGTAMIATAIARAFARPITQLTVHTCTLDSQWALPFYMGAGFAPVRREIQVLDDPRLCGLLPREAAAHIPIIAAP